LCQGFKFWTKTVVIHFRASRKPLDEKILKIFISLRQKDLAFLTPSGNPLVLVKSAQVRAIG
jgi:hypothetical protein